MPWNMHKVRKKHTNKYNINHNNKLTNETKKSVRFERVRFQTFT